MILILFFLEIPQSELQTFFFLRIRRQHLPLYLAGDFSDWTTSNDVLPYDSSHIPEGAVVCHLARYRLESLRISRNLLVITSVPLLCCFCVHSWFSTEQIVDLKAEGLWEELLDDFQPEIIIEDWWVMS